MHKDIKRISFNNFVTNINGINVLLSNLTQPWMETLQFVFGKISIIFSIFRTCMECSSFNMNQRVLLESWTHGNFLWNHHFWFSNKTPWNEQTTKLVKLPISLAIKYFNSVWTILNWPAKCIFNSINEPSTVGMPYIDKNAPHDTKMYAISKFGDVVISKG